MRTLSSRGAGVSSHGRHVCLWLLMEWDAMIGGGPPTWPNATQWLATADIRQRNCESIWRGYLPSIIVTKYNVDKYLFDGDVVDNPYIKVLWNTREEKRNFILSPLTSDVVDRVHQSTRRTTHGNITSECRSNEFFDYSTEKDVYTGKMLLYLLERRPF